MATSIESAPDTVGCDPWHRNLSVSGDQIQLVSGL
ncbi:hypothetical protein NPIL_217191, partial [Nephila pilipes]